MLAELAERPGREVRVPSVAWSGSFAHRDPVSHYGRRPTPEVPMAAPARAAHRFTRGARPRLRVQVILMTNGAVMGTPGGARFERMEAR